MVSHNKEPYGLSVEEAFEEFKSGPLGLSGKEVDLRLRKFGFNSLPKKKGFSVVHEFLAQFKDVMVIILLIACVVSFFLGEVVDASVIFFIVLLNAVIGFMQEFKAEKAVEALQSMISPHASVLRNNVVQDIEARELVPGDILLIEEGSSIAADARLIEVVELKVDEAPLTGESNPVSKIVKSISRSNITSGDMRNMVFMGTNVTHGRGRALVTGTGSGTEFGKIANLTASIKEDKSPLQKELINVGKFIAKAAIFISVVVFLMGVFEQRPTVEMLLFAVSLAVAAVPEGLPATVTVALALGVQRMAKRKAIVRKLSSVETLGSTTVICSDKTGTLTKNEMTVSRVWVNHKLFSVDGVGYKPKGNFTLNSNVVSDGNLDFILKIGLLCNDASYSSKTFSGDPTEKALVISAMKKGFFQEPLSQEFPRIHELPFDSSRKMMTTIHRNNTQLLAFSKGAPKELLEKCTKFNHNGHLVDLTPKLRGEILAANESMASSALRVLGFAYRDVTGWTQFDSSEQDLVFVGLQGMIDPPRKDVKDAVCKCKEAGIKIVVITGDYGITAKAIAMDVGIASDSTRIVTGVEMNSLEDSTLLEYLKGEVIFARVSPEHKLRVVELLESRGEVVAVTGDGVNDAPALKKASIGIAMGITGTDVSKEASNVVLMDDSFATIVKAVEEGRTIYKNITKFLRYLFSSNLGEIVTVILGMLFFPEALIISAIQLLWINLGTDVLPALALGVEPSEKDVMSKPPRNPKQRMIGFRSFFDWLGSGIIIGLGTFFVFMYFNDDLERAMTMAFTVLMLYQMVNVLNCKTAHNSIFSMQTFSNWKLWVAIFVSIVLQVLVVQLPFFNSLFHTVPLSLSDWLLLVGVSLTILVYEELKLVVFSLLNKQHALKAASLSH